MSRGRDLPPLGDFERQERSELQTDEQIELRTTVEVTYAIARSEWTSRALVESYLTVVMDGSGRRRSDPEPRPQRERHDAHHRGCGGMTGWFVHLDLEVQPLERSAARPLLDNTFSRAESTRPELPNTLLAQR